MKGSGRFESTAGKSFSKIVRRAVDGSSAALNRLFGELIPSLAMWARGKLPLWARARADTDDLVQAAVVGLLGRLPRMETRQRRTIRAYLRQTIRHRITDEVRRAGKLEVPAVEEVEHPSPESGPLARALEREQEERYREALDRLSTGERELIVGRLELAYSYEQLALATGKSSTDAARVAVRRAMLHLAQEMAD
ncbi:MAG: sigma-70 family RNA polymerase sigma factor [Holophagales bacterium]|nr:sigma-70 family RNA polymerase sigma factor [Holophagales bacterium]